jgi:hypothetical protein
MVNPSSLNLVVMSRCSQPCRSSIRSLAKHSCTSTRSQMVGLGRLWVEAGAMFVLLPNAYAELWRSGVWTGQPSCQGKAVSISPFGSAFVPVAKFV